MGILHEQKAEMMTATGKYTKACFSAYRNVQCPGYEYDLDAQRKSFSIRERECWHYLWEGSFGHHLSDPFITVKAYDYNLHVLDYPLVEPRELSIPLLRAGNSGVRNIKVSSIPSWHLKSAMRAHSVWLGKYQRWGNDEKILERPLRGYPGTWWNISLSDQSLRCGPWRRFLHGTSLEYVSWFLVKIMKKHRDLCEPMPLQMGWMFHAAAPLVSWQGKIILFYYCLFMRPLFDFVFDDTTEHQAGNYRYLGNELLWMEEFIKGKSWVKSSGKESIWRCARR